MTRFSESDPFDPAYTELRAAEPTRHEVAPNSWLAQAGEGVSALRSRSERTAPVSDSDWDPLTDPWPTLYAGCEPAALGHSVRDEVDPLGLSYDTAAWTLANSSTDIASSAAELAGMAFEAPAPAPAAEPEIVVRTPIRSVPREAQAAIQTQPVELGEHPSGPLPRAGVWPPTGAVPESPAGLVERDAPVARRYDVTLMGPLGEPEFGFGGGHWYSLIGEQAREVPVGDAMSAHPDKAGQIVQLACWWLREQPNTARALDLATELSMAVAELARRELSRGRRRSA